MDDILPWIGYPAAYVLGGLVGYFGAALFSGSAQAALRADNEELRGRLKALEAKAVDEGRLPEHVPRIRGYGCSEGLAS